MLHPLAHTWDLIPQEMRELDQWCISGEDKAPMLAVRGSDSFYNASPTTGPWLSFADACEIGTLHGKGIGFIITPDDPFCCIDLDVKDASSLKFDGTKYDPVQWTSFEQLARYEKIVGAFPSYSEVSPSGKGLHVWMRGAIGEGVKRDGVEIYSQHRFIRFTGWAFGSVAVRRNDKGIVNVVIGPEPAFPITEQQLLLTSMVGELRKGLRDKVDLVEVASVSTDTEIVERAMGASNSDKFNELCDGDWERMNFPSQSEADMALMSMFAFYSHSNSQCRRLFRYSKLGEREKAVKDDVFLNYTLTIIRTRQENEHRLQLGLLAKSEEFRQNLIKQANQKEQFLKQQQAEEIQARTSNNVNTIVQKHTQPWEDNYSPPVPKITEVFSDAVPQLGWPPGLMGDLAKFVYNSAERPIKEVAIVAALGMMAGICGKAWNVSRTGLNIYMILVAQSGVGKESMSSGTAKMVEKMRMSVPMISAFINYSDFVSGPALMKGVAANQCFVNISSEWGKTMKRLGDESGRDAAMGTFRTALTKLYSKSGASDIVGGASHSDKDKDTKDVAGVAFSLIGETTPGTFFDSLTEAMMEDGLISRFDVLEYTGLRPPANDNPIDEPDNKLLEDMCAIAIQSLTLLSRYQHQDVPLDTQTEAYSKEFRDFADRKINEHHSNEGDLLSTSEDFRRALWNRAHLKFLRISALLAVGDNCVNPCITMVHAQWAKQLVLNGVAVLCRKMDSGEIGSGENACLAKVKQILKDYLLKPLPKSNFEVNSLLKEKNTISRRFLQQKTFNIACFRNSRQGAAMSLKLVIATMTSDGTLTQVKPPEMLEMAGTSGEGFRLLDLS